MSDLIEAVAERINGATVICTDLSSNDFRNMATAALAALRETHHLIPKDQEPVGWLYVRQGFRPALSQSVPEYPDLVRIERVYALEKRHDD